MGGAAEMQAPQGSSAPDARRAAGSYDSFALQLSRKVDHFLYLTEALAL